MTKANSIGPHVLAIRIEGGIPKEFQVMKAFGGPAKKELMEFIKEMKAKYGEDHEEYDKSFKDYEKLMYATLSWQEFPEAGRVDLSGNSEIYVYKKDE